MDEYYLKLTNEYRNWLVSTTHHKRPARVFHEYAEQHFKPLPTELLDAQQRLQKAIKEAVTCAENLADKMRRFNAKNRTAKWHRRSWRRKGW